MALPEIPVKELELKKVELLDDGKTLALHIPNLKTGSHGSD